MDKSIKFFQPSFRQYLLVDQIMTHETPTCVTIESMQQGVVKEWMMVGDTVTESTRMYVMSYVLLLCRVMGCCVMSYMPSCGR